jgi:hypothetical protein
MAKMSEFPIHVQRLIMEKMAEEDAAANIKKQTLNKTREHKYNVAAVEDRTKNGIVFSSKREMKFYELIRSTVPSGVVIDLQPKFLLQEACVADKQKYRPIYYIGDFLLNGKRGDDPSAPLGEREYVIDVKGMETDVFRLKEKMFAKRYGRKIHKVKTEKQLVELLKLIYGDRVNKK